MRPRLFQFSSQKITFWNSRQPEGLTLRKSLRQEPTQDLFQHVL